MIQDKYSISEWCPNEICSIRGHLKIKCDKFRELLCLPEGLNLDAFFSKIKFDQRWWQSDGEAWQCRWGRRELATLKKQRRHISSARVERPADPPCSSRSPRVLLHLAASWKIILPSALSMKCLNSTEIYLKLHLTLWSTGILVAISGEMLVG